MKHASVAPILVAWLFGLVIRSAAAEEVSVAYSQITLDDLRKAIAEKRVTLIDCSGTRGYRKAHIPGAIDLEASRDKLPDLLPKNKDALIVCYCSGGNCPKYRNGCWAAIKAGYTNVKFYGGGLHEWKSAGYSTESGSSSDGEKK